MYKKRYLDKNWLNIRLQELISEKIILFYNRMKEIRYNKNIENNLKDYYKKKLRSMKKKKKKPQNSSKKRHKKYIIF